MAERFSYLVPMILPVLPRASGKTVVGMRVANMLREVGAEGDATLSVDIRLLGGGEVLAAESSHIAVKDGIPDKPVFLHHFTRDTLCYAEIAINADRPIFKKALTECSFALVERPDKGTFNVHASYKFSDPAIIEMMRRVGEYCLVHPAQYVSKADNAGNSILIINPFDGPIVARAQSGAGKQMRKRIAPRDCVIWPLDEILVDGEWSCVLYTGNNRYPVWDVRHVYGDPVHINRLDHMEYYRGDLTVQAMTPARFLRTTARQGLRMLGLRAN